MKTAAFLSVMILIGLSGCKSLQLPEEEEVPEIFETNSSGSGQALQIEFRRGEAHNHPLMGIWVEDLKGNYIQTLYVAKSIARGVFEHGDATSGKWMPGEIRRPAALPVWSHRRGVQEADGLYVPTKETAIPDTYTGATPGRSFLLNTRLDKPLNEKFYVYFEINQTWDWNEYWTNNKYPDNEAYKTSCQPSLIYAALVDPSKPGTGNNMDLVGRGHHAGEDGEIYRDIETMTTALNITREVTVKIVENTD